MSPAPRQPSGHDWRREDSEPPAASKDGWHVEITKVKFRLAQLEKDVAALETTTEQLGGEFGDSKVKLLPIAEYVSRQQADTNARAGEWRGLVRGVTGTLVAAGIIGALALIGRLVWQEILRK